MKSALLGFLFSILCTAALGANLPVIHVEEARTDYIGTGFYLRLPSGRVGVITNAHVCNFDDATEMLVEGRPSKIIAIDVPADLCMLAPVYKDVDALQIAKSVQIPSYVITLGYPNGVPQLIARIGVIYEEATGKIEITFPTKCNKVGLIPENGKCYHQLSTNPITAPTYPGSSGSPVLGQNARVVGVIQSADGRHNGYAIPLARLRAFIKGH